MKIIMNKTAPGSVDGIRVVDYVAGAEYDLSSSTGARELAASFLGSGLAREAVAAVVVAPSLPVSEPESVETEPVEPAELPAAKPVKPGKAKK